MGNLKKAVCMGLCVMIIPFAACDKGGDKLTAKDRAALQAATYVDAMQTTIQNAKSFKVKLVNKESYKDEYFKEGTTLLDSEQIYYSSETTTEEITISETENGIAVHYISTYGYTDEEETYISVEESIYKEGILYFRSYEKTDEEMELPLWEKEENGNEPEFGMIPSTIISKLSHSKEVKDAAEAFFEELESAIAEEIIANDVTDGEIVINYDYTADVKEWIDYFSSIDETKTTLGSLLNKVLSEISPGLTAEAVLGQLSAYSKMTVSEALTAIDAFLALKHNTSLQEIKDTLVNSELMEVIFKDFMELDEATIAKIKAWSLESLKTGEIGSAVIGDLINGYLVESGIVPAPEAGEAPVDYVKVALEALTEALGKTLAEFELNFDFFNEIELKELGSNVALTFNEANELKEWSFGFETEIKGNEYDEEETTHVGYTTITSETTLTLSDLSASAVEIETPPVINFIKINGVFDEKGWLTVSSTKNGVSGYWDYYDETGENFLFWVNYTTDECLLQYGQTLTATVEVAGGWGSQEVVHLYFQNNEVQFNLTLNEDGTYEVSNFPNMEDMVEWYNKVYLPSQKE